MVTALLAVSIPLATWSEVTVAAAIGPAVSVVPRRSEVGLGQGVELEIGSDPALPVPVVLQPVKTECFANSEVSSFVSSDHAIKVAVTLRADSNWTLTHKSVQITNSGKNPIRLLNLVLNRMPLGSHRAEGGDRGFPLYLDGQEFYTLAHPAGFAHIEGKDIVLRQHPGCDLEPGKTFQSMEAIYGAAKPGGARKLFVDYVQSRMCRVTLHHDKPYSILESFGGQQEGDFKDYYARGVSASYLLRHLKEVGESERANGVKFDFYGLEFWHDRAGDLKGFNKENFPNGFDPVRDQILKLGMKPSLWIASSGTPDWTIDLNPAVRDCFNVSPGVGAFCRASEPLNQIYKDGFIYQMKVNHAGLLKFDNLEQNCVNPAHHHLPGPLYSTEAIYNGVIDFLDTLHKVNPDVFLMLYWGYRSPWWLLHGDTYFECGDHIEAASPAQYPTPYARDAVTQRLDQAQLNIRDTPWLGKDSLGVWLSDWTWNSGIGSARWQEGVVMDMARGGLLFQIWTDTNWLTPPERRQVATFMDLFRANADCFSNCSFALGDPNKAAPYAYRCKGKEREFLAINNACLRDSLVDLSKLLPKGHDVDVYRWYPNPAKLRLEKEASSLDMRPYEVDLLEVVPAGHAPSMGRRFESTPVEGHFEEQSRALPVSFRSVTSSMAALAKWSPIKILTVSSRGGAALSVSPEGIVTASGENASNDVYTVDALVGPGRLTGLLLETLTDADLPGHGPGRAVNGNYALNSIQVKSVMGKAGDRGLVVEKRDIKLSSAVADFSQVTFGGWPVAAAIDGDPKTGWSIHPRVGESHAAAFRFDRALVVPGKAALIVTLTFGDNKHNIGCFRLSLTQDKTPLLPQGFLPRVVVLSSTVPATKTGGLLVLTEGKPEDVATGSMAGKPLKFSTVWARRSNWDCPWTAWRSEVGPSAAPRKLEINVERRRRGTPSLFKVYFLPK